MPCNSVSIATVKMNEQMAWLLSMVQSMPDLPIIAAIAEELRRELGEAFEVTLHAYAPLVNIRRKDSAYVGATVELYASGSQISVASPQLRDQLVMAVGVSLERTAATLLGELARADLVAEGFNITADEVTGEGVRMISFSKEIA